MFAWEYANHVNDVNNIDNILGNMFVFVNLLIPSNLDNIFVFNKVYSGVKNTINH